MGEESLAVVPSDRAVEQAIVSLKKGAHLLKYGRRGKPKFCPFRLTTDEKLLIWYSGQEERQLRLSSIIDIIRGQRSVNFQKQLKPDRECQSFSIIHANGERSLDLICKDKTQADSWFLGLKAVTSRCHNPRSFRTLENRRGAQSCINSPASYIRRKHNLGIAEGNTKFSQVHSLSGSPTQSFSERCFSDGLSCSSDSFYSESSLSTMQNVIDFLGPCSPYVESDYLKKTGSVRASPKIQTNKLNQVPAPPREEENVLRDVFVWGEGAGGGCLGGGVDKMGNNNGAQFDALLPKIPESTAMLDVQKISLGAKYAAFVTKQGEVFSWGEGKRGRLGHKIDMDIAFPKIVDSLTGISVKDIACGEYQTCALTLSGEIYTWGDNCYGTGVDGEDGNRSYWLARQLSGPLDGVNVSCVSCGEWHTAIVSTSGQLFTYGDGTFGVLGHGDVQTISQPKEVELLKGLRVKSVSCGPWHTAAIVEIMVDRFKFNDPGGKLFTWGDGDKGRLGHADQGRKLLPTCVASLVDHDFVQVSCGRMLTVGLTNMGMVYTMGSVLHGQLGNPQARDKSITIVQGKLRNEFVREIASGSYHIAVLTSKRNVYTWGKGVNGQLGLGDIEDRNSPTLVESLRDRQVESITCGSNSTAAICLHRSVSSSDQLACKGCGTAFGFTRKKHNCYNCGLLFCRACSSKKAINASSAPKKSKPFRVCDPCFNQLQRTLNSSNQSNLGKHSPRPLLITKKTVSDEKEDVGEATSTHSPMMALVKHPNRGDNQQPFDTSSSLWSGLPRWGQVSCPVLFRKYREEQTMVYDLRNQLSSTSPVCSQGNFPESKSTTSTALNMEYNLSNSDKILIEEVQKLRAQTESLEKLCQTRKEKIQECQQRIEETWSLAKEEAANCKAAKEVIKVLTSRLHTMSVKLSSGREVEDQVGSNLRSPTLNGMHPIVVAKQVHPDAGHLEDRKLDSLSNSPILFSNTLKSINNRRTDSDDIGSAKDSCVRRTDSEHDEIKALKLEWVEQYQPGVYITFITLPSGQKGLKRVRFSRKKFTEKEAERWWEENQIGVYENYGIQEYISSNQR